MRLKVKLSELPAGSCFVNGRKKTVRKKLADGRVVVVGKGGRVRTRDVKGNPTVSPTSCPLKYIGVGLRRHKETVVEIGDGRPKRIIRIRLR